MDHRIKQPKRAAANQQWPFFVFVPMDSCTGRLAGLHQCDDECPVYLPRDNVLPVAGATRYIEVFAITKTQPWNDGHTHMTGDCIDPEKH